MATILELRYSLSAPKKVNWSQAQEDSISKEFPFDLNGETPAQFVQRTYLQFLWLPESLMPLHLLVPGLQRVSAPSTSESHPLHGLLDELLLAVPSVTQKYHMELPQILNDGGGAGEMEEMMMWYSISHEQGEGATEPWTDDKWRETWLNRLERREVQIQILLYFLKLSLPTSPPPKRKKRKRSDSTVTKNEDYLEAFMDKLSTWQLLASLERSEDSAHKNGEGEGRDWMQVFCEDVVESQFKAVIPDHCSLLRSKVFRHSPFADDVSEASTSRASSPELDQSSAELSTSKTNSRELARARSRSLSVSLAQEKEHKGRAPSVGASLKRRAVIREISMSRVFKPKAKPSLPQPATTNEKAVSEASRKDPSREKSKDMGVTLVEETPVKPRASSRSLSFSQPAFGQPIKSSVSLSSGRLFGGGNRTWSAATAGDENDNDDEWQIESSPDILLLTPLRGDFDSDQDGADQGPATPTKRSQRTGK